MKRTRVPECAIAEVVIAWLENAGADVYQEVECAGGVADIVARVGAELWIVETKSAISLGVLYQAMERRRDAHRVYVAAPRTRNVRDFEWLCRELGIGLLTVEQADQVCGIDPRVTELCASNRWNRRPVRLAASLTPGHKTHAKAGSVGGGGRWTPFRATCEALAGFVRANPGTTLKAAIAGIKHHYRSPSSARSSMRTWVERGRVPGIRVETKHGAILLYPAPMSDGAAIVPSEGTHAE